LTRAGLASLTLAACSCVGPQSAPAEETAQVEPPPTASLPQRIAQTGDGTHAWLSGRVQSTADFVDSFFGSRRSDAEANTSEIRLRLDATAEEGEGVEFKPRVKVRLILPRTEDRLALIIAGNANENFGVDSDPLDDIQEELTESDERNAALGAEYFLLDDLKRNAKLEAGVRFKDSKVIPRLGARYRQEFELEPWLARFTERLAWQSDDGFDSRTIVDFDRVLTEALFFRATTSLYWYEDRDGFFYYLSAVLTQRLTQRNYLAYSWVNSFVTEPDHVLESVRLRPSYRRRLWRDWAYLELAPEVRFAEAEDYEAAYAFLFRLDFYFGAEHR
jgi:hypothetical protein